MSVSHRQGAKSRSTLSSGLKKRINGRRTRFEQLEPRAMMAVDSILHWNNIALKAVADDFSKIYGAPEENGPTESSRALAIISVAMYDAINSIKGQYEPYLIKVVGVQGANIDSAVGQAAYDTLVAMYPKQKAVFDTDLHDWLGTIANSASKNFGIALGNTVATAVLNARANDHSHDMMTFTLGNAPGQYQVDPLHPNQMVLSPMWGKVTPFGVNNIANFNEPPPPALNSQAYTDAYNEVLNYGGDGTDTPTLRTPEQTEIGIFWGYDGTIGIGVPPRFYNQIIAQISQQQGNTEYQNARLFAMANVAMADAGIASWNVKYEYDFWRPVTAIRDAANDGNPNTVANTTWTPLGAPASNQTGDGVNFTPPFPSYDSGHATFGGALFTTLAHFYGTDNVAFSISSDEFNGVTTDGAGNVRPLLPPRTYTSFSSAAEENGQSRIYLGIHWAFDKTAGIDQGDKIANYIDNHLFQPMKKGMPAGSNKDMLMAYMHTLVTMTFMDANDHVNRQVVMLQTTHSQQSTVYTAVSIQPLFPIPGIPSSQKTHRQVVYTAPDNLI